MKRILLILLFLAIILSGLLVIITTNHDGLSIFLSPDRRVDANTLIIEGWLPENVLEMAKYEINRKEYNLIVTTGIKYYGIEYFMVAMNAYLIFYPRLQNVQGKEIDDHLIEFEAYSEMDGKYRTHINFFVNDSLMTDFIINKKKQKYSVKWRGPLESIDSLVIQFDNDMVDDYGDRNLYVKEIVIDKRITIPYNFNSVYDIGSLGGQDRIPNNFDSSPEIARNKLISGGLDSSKIIAVAGSKTSINRTLKSAVAFSRWLKTSGHKIDGINVVTISIHARRTWLTYKKVLGNSYNIGIISLPDPKVTESDKHDTARLLREILGLAYYRIILIPYQLF